MPPFTPRHLQEGDGPRYAISGPFSQRAAATAACLRKPWCVARGQSPAKSRATRFDSVDSCAWSKEPPVPPWVTSYGRVFTYPRHAIKTKGPIGRIRPIRPIKSSSPSRGGQTPRSHLLRVPSVYRSDDSLPSQTSVRDAGAVPAVPYRRTITADQSSARRSSVVVMPSCSTKGASNSATASPWPL